MAIETLPAICKKLTFDGVTSSDYGVQILGKGAFNAPERAVELVNVPGRNGAVAIDKGYFENIEVTYPATVGGSNTTNFADSISAFRNYLCSKKGYCRLTDDFNPGEYRLAIFKSGVEIEPEALSVGEFNITFDCKPQRYLTSGESAISVTSGDTISNPTLYDASPMIEAEGYGTITIGDYEVEIQNVVLGEVTVAKGTSTIGISVATSVVTSNLDSALYNSGDSITVSATTPYARFYRANSSYSFVSASDVSGGTVEVSTTDVVVRFDASDWTFTAGTDATDMQTCTFTLTYELNGATSTYNCSAIFRRIYSATDETITAQFNSLGYPSSAMRIYNLRTLLGKAVADSTVSVLGTPTYMDCDLGVCYKIENDAVVDLNAYIDLGSDLPVLKAGSNTITYDNTITDLKIIPHWWIL